MEKSHNVGNFLFIIFWWIVQHVNLKWAHKLLYWGLRDGSFPTGHVADPALGIDMFGRHFTSPVGLADGIDKRGNTLDQLMQMGYSFGTFGPYTLEKEMPPQEKYFFKNDRAIITQCSGYRNPGLLKMLPWFVKRRYLPHFVGIDVAIPAENEESNIKQGRHFAYVDEFVLMAQRSAPYCDFITLDFSHPNSELCFLMVDASTILPIIRAVKETVTQAAPIRPPKVFVKIPLDLNVMEVPLVAQTLLSSGADGVVVAGPMSLAKNTRVRIQGAKEHQMSGTLIGRPTHEYANELIRKLYTQLQGRIPIIASGGIFDGATAFAHIAAGATFIALDESSLIYEGPGVFYKVHKELSEILQKRNLKSVTDAIGLDSKEAPQAPNTAKPAFAPTASAPAGSVPAGQQPPTPEVNQNNSTPQTPNSL